MSVLLDTIRTAFDEIGWNYRITHTATGARLVTRFTTGDRADARDVAVEIHAPDPTTVTITSPRVCDRPAPHAEALARTAAAIHWRFQLVAFVPSADGTALDAVVHLPVDHTPPTVRQIGRCVGAVVQAVAEYAPRLHQVATTGHTAPI